MSLQKSQLSHVNLRHSTDGSSVPSGMELLNSVALRGGKQFRPRLCFTIASALNVPEALISPYAVAAERVHNATLLHDDVIDESNIRRGKPTLNAEGKNQRAVLGGDLLLVRALHELGALERWEIVQDLLATLIALVEGEWLQFEARCHLDVGMRHLREVAEKKTASLIAWCCATPAKLSGREDVSLALHRFGTHLGIAFQLLDDCLDFDRSSGKPFAQDLREGQINFVMQQLLANHPELSPAVGEILGNPHATPSSHLVHFLPEAIELVRNQAAIELQAAAVVLANCALTEDERRQIEVHVLDSFRSQLKGVI